MVGRSWQKNHLEERGAKADNVVLGGSARKPLRGWDRGKARRGRGDGETGFRVVNEGGLFGKAGTYRSRGEYRGRRGKRKSTKLQLG